jgi:phosphatidylglycerol lysyltransferase
MATAVTRLEPSPMAGRLASHGRLARKAFPIVLLVGVVAIVFSTLRTLVGEIDPAQIGGALRAIGPWRIMAAIGLTVASHLLLTCYDVLGLRALGKKLPYRTAARAAFTSYALSHSLGFAAITGGSARLRIYGAAGLRPFTVAKLVLIAGCAFWGGIAATAAISMIASTRPLAMAGYILSPDAAHAVGLAVLSAFALLPLLPRLMPRLKARFGVDFALPSPTTLVLLLGVAAVDLAFASLALFVLVPGLGPDDFAQLYLAYSLAVIAGLLTHVPGGVGVFEAIMIAVLPIRGPQVLAALIAYRAIYYLLPLVAALLLNAGLEAHALRRYTAPFVAVLRVIAMEVSPWIVAAMTFGGGLVLLLSGALPSIHGRMRLVVELLPLPFIEASHLAASLVGTALLLVAPALVARLEGGMRIARLLFMLGAAFSLAKGLDFEEAIVMLAMAGFMQLAAPAFYRRTMGAFSTHNRGWLVAAIVAVTVSALSGFVAYRHLPYDSQLWWEFALRSDAPRFLRATFAAGILVAGFALRELLYRPEMLAGLDRLPEGMFEKAIRHAPRSDAALALTGDKRFLVSSEGDAFLMFRPRNRTWVVMGDPVGPRERWRDLAWDLRRLSDNCYARICFYQVSEAMLPIIVELGLKPIKYGEEAHIPVETFSLIGPQMKSLRNSRARAEREGLEVSIVPARELPARLTEVEPISTAWLASHGAAEKRFSLGSFAPTYLSNFDLAVVKARDSAVPIAFANIWRSGDGRELSVDLMRHLPAAPPATMDFLFLELIQLARREGYHHFNLGLAPLSGVQGGMLAPSWARLARLAFSMDSWGYNFAGLRRFKEKFAPQWQPRYIAAPAGLPGLRALIDLIRLVGGK